MKNSDKISPSKDKKIYTCPMHPEIKKNKPGSCPKCGMDLVESKGKQDLHGQHDHQNGDHDDHGMGHGSAKEFLNRFYITTFLLIPILMLSQPGLKLLGYADFQVRKYLLFALATLTFWIGKVFFVHASHEIKAKKPGMMTLVSLGVGTGYLFSAVSTFIPALHTEFYLEITTLIWVLLFGHFLEARSSTAAGNALQEVAKLLPSKAHVKHGKEVRDTDINELKNGMIIIVKPGEKVPADGEIIKGSTSFNEAHISGESKPVKKGKGNTAIAGAISQNSTVEIKLTKVGENSTIGQIQTLVKQAQNTKPRAQSLANQASYWLTLTALSVAILTLLVWTLVVGQTFVFSLTLAITVLVIACPHALGLAIPTVSTIATQIAVKNGIFIKDMAKLEETKKTDVVVFDKTGTLTEGKPQVTEFKFPNNLKKTAKELKLNKPEGMSYQRLIQSLVLSLEEHSSHPIADKTVKYLKSKKAVSFEVNDFNNIAGKGIEGKVKNHKVLIGTHKLMKNNQVTFYAKLEKNSRSWEQEGKTVVYVAVDGKHIASFSLSDKIKKEAKKAVAQLHELGVKVAMLTGDTQKVANAVAKELNIDTVIAEVLPNEKYKHISNLQEQGKTVLMIGDGVNDAPALTQANIGVAVGTGTDVAVEAGDIVLTRSNPQDAASLLKLARKVYRKMIENLVWAFSYNIVAIPAAAGLFIPWGMRLKPEIGALLMSLSSVIVVINAFQLKKIKI